jgi:hypothetical protein
MRNIFQALAMAPYISGNNLKNVAFSSVWGCVTDAALQQEETRLHCNSLSELDFTRRFDLEAGVTWASLRFHAG